MLDKLIALDERVFHFLHTWDTPAALWQVIAIYGVYLVPVILVWFWLARRREPALFAFLAGFIAWVGINNLIGHFVERMRPVDYYHLVLPMQEGFFHRPGSSFPSDHTAFMAAIITIFYFYGERRVAYFVGGIAFINVLGRIVVGFHWPGDILIGALVGLATAAALWLLRRPIERLLISPIVSMARKIGL